METVRSAIAEAADTRQRIAWIDSAKTIGIALMIVDHSLIYFGHESHWSRISITRLAEPLLVLSLFHILSSRGRAISFKRWLQIGGAAVIETGLHSYREGYLYFGILTSIAVVVPLAVSITRSTKRFHYGIVVSAALFSLVATETHGFHMDYGPFLLLAQIPVAVHLTKHRACIFMTLLSIGTSFLGVFALTGLGIPISANVWTLLIGQPLAVALFFALRLPSWICGKGMGISVFARWPLTIYLGHLMALQMAVGITAASASQATSSESSALEQKPAPANIYTSEYRK